MATIVNVKYAVPPHGYCACGELLHYTNPLIQMFTDRMIAKHGQTVKMKTTSGDAWFLVPRHFLALHGIKGVELADLGFPRVEAETS